MTTKPFVVVSGLPGSGKTTLARRLAPALGLRLIDKDDILEGLFEQKGIGDTGWRRKLSREGDAILRRDALALGAAVLSSFWHLPGMPEDSGTPSDWLRDCSNQVVHVHCACDVHIAAERFFRRKRHAGHIDARSYSDVLASVQQLLPLGVLDLGVRIDVDTSQTLVDALLNALTNRILRSSNP